MEIVYDLGNGIKLAKVDVEEPREQDLNARVMNNEMFNRLAQNIKNDQRLESLPFCALTEKGIEVVSGHHRLRASRKAGLKEIYILLDDTGMRQSSLRSKQLSHNSLSGTDNEQMLKEIYGMIDDAADRISAYMPREFEEAFDKAKVKSVAFNAEFVVTTLVFMSYEHEMFNDAVERIKELPKVEEMMIADIEVKDKVQKAMRRVQEEFEIRAMGTILSKMAEIVLEKLGEGETQEPVEEEKKVEPKRERKSKKEKPVSEEEAWLSE